MNWVINYLYSLPDSLPVAGNYPTQNNECLPETKNSYVCIYLFILKSIMVWWEFFNILKHRNQSGQRDFIYIFNN